MKPIAQQNVTFDLAAIRARLRSSDGPRYWRSLEEVARTREFTEFLHREFPERASEWIDGLSRRHFLKLMGASLALAGLASCTRQPAEKIVPYIRQPEELLSGQPLFFATAMTLGGYATGLLVESHNGHPTKIEGNPEHPMSLGATNAFHQASLLDLYDPDRSQAVLHQGQISNWEAFLSALNDSLQTQERRKGVGLRILTETGTSPTLHAQIGGVLKKFPEARWHQYEPINCDNVHGGAQIAFGQIVAPQYRFDRARVVVALDSDFMFAHPAALRYARDFMNARRVTAGRSEMNRLYAVEPVPTVTGSNADHRLPLRMSEVTNFAIALGAELGVGRGSATNFTGVSDQRFLSAVAADLKTHRGQSIIIAGETQPPFVHALVHAMNQALGNTGTTIHYTASAESNAGNQVQSLRDLVDELKQGRVEVLLILGGNPAFNAPADFAFAEHLKGARLAIHLSSDRNETSALCHWHIPQNHYLESWSDARSYDGTASIVQPLILPLYAGRSAHELLDALLQSHPRTDYDIVRTFWQSQQRWNDFERGWRRTLHDGLVAETAFPIRQVELSLDQITRAAPRSAIGHLPSAIELSFRPDPTIWDGRFADNGWLQELPKPITKLTWDNAALIGPATAQKRAVSNGDFVELEASGRRLRVPVWITPGMADDCVTVHLGYGRTRIGRVGRRAGFDAFILRSADSFWSGLVTLNKASGRYQFATTQGHMVIDSAEREVYRAGTLADFLAHPEFVKESTRTPSAHETLFNPEAQLFDSPRWAMSIDLTTCIGCNACVLACQSENNIPVVGKAQVARGREMHWLRVDSYFSGELDRPGMNHQPVPCMHCETAPCELVCPVGATLHDHEGLNLQVYNRCVGTRYCSNNCPYKVRRFNFLQYADYHTPSLKPMRNPNVTVRWRGVMEKCTYCVQRISVARITAKNENRPIRDGEVLTACQQVCPTEAIIFGDLSDPNSRIAKLKKHPLDFSMLAELNTRPRTTYLAKLRNPNPALENVA
ncbi:MAG TPA: TAT-variant-translocated molybdopterin oxidoreductase [Verrucomicrobiae bacterium]|nr:TAT-variant-translocated molybdopterin oxidoreductase [Verrucomicrobiae bacterium]